MVPTKISESYQHVFFFVALGTGQERPAKKVLGRSNGNPKRGFKEVSRHKKQQLKLEVSMIWVNSRTCSRRLVTLNGGFTIRESLQNPFEFRSRNCSNLARTIAGVPYF